MSNLLRPHWLTQKSPLSSTISQGLLKFISMSEWWYLTISSSVSPFSFCLIFPSNKVFSSESVLPLRWPKYWNFSFSNKPSSEYTDWLVWSPCYPRDSQQSSPAPQFETLIILYIPTLTFHNSHHLTTLTSKTTGKTTALTMWIFLCKVMSAFQYAV